jgi:hypothetical protein
VTPKNTRHQCHRPQLLKATNRLTEAEPLMRQVVGILATFRRSTGHEHPHRAAGQRNYQHLLHAMNFSDAEIQQRMRDATGGEEVG